MYEVQRASDELLALQVSAVAERVLITDTFPERKRTLAMRVMLRARCILRAKSGVVAGVKLC